MKTTDIYQTKRTLFTFSHHLSEHLPKAQQKFVHEMIYGLGKSTSVIVTDIARALNEEIALIQTTKRLCRNLSQFDSTPQLHQNYLNQVKKHLSDDNLVIVDESDIIKPYGEQFEGLGYVRDGSTGKIEKGYTTLNFSIASTKNTHPIPIYSHLCSAEEPHFQSMAVETAKGFNVTKGLFGDTPYTLVMDRGYDSNEYYKYLHHQDTLFITRLKNNRYLKYQGKSYKVPDLAARRKGKIRFDTQIKGQSYELKVSHINVQLPALKGVPLSMVVVYGYGKKPMKLLTNKPLKQKSDVLRIVKGYITRWRIEELFRVEKGALNLEKVRTLSLNSLRMMYRMVNYLIGHYTLSLEKDTLYAQMVLIRSKALTSADKVRFHLYRFIRGISSILVHDKQGIGQRQVPDSYQQLSLAL